MLDKFTQDNTSQRIKKDYREWLRNHIASQPLSFILPGVGTMLATFFIPTDTNIICAGIYGFIGGCLGLGLLYLIVYLVILIRTPYRQRDEARKTAIELESQLIEKIKNKDIALNIGLLIFQGTDVLKAFKIAGNDSTFWLTIEFKTWRQNVSNFFADEPTLKKYDVLWFKDMNTDMTDIDSEHFIKTCENGLARLENIYKEFTQ